MPTPAETANSRPVLILVPGPLHLFHTTGLYVLRDLVAHCDVVLVVDSAYAGDKIFEAAAQWPGVIASHVLPPEEPPLGYQKAVIQLARELFARHSPQILLQHNDWYPMTIHFIREADRQGNCLRATFSLGLNPDRQADAIYWRMAKILNIQQRLKIPYGLASLIFLVRARWNYFRHYRLLPFLLTGRPLKTSFDLYGPRPLQLNTSDKTDVQLMYTEREKRHYLRISRPGVIEVVKHPVADLGHEVQEELGLERAQRRIMLLPTCSLVTVLATKLGSSEAAIEGMADIWHRTLVRLQARLSGMPAFIKLHPASLRDPLMMEVAARLKQRMPGLTFIDPATPAEPLILGSSCIVGDVSSTLWWARMLGGRSVVSVNAWGLPTADELRHYPGIVYVTDPDQLEHADLETENPSLGEGLPPFTATLLAHLPAAWQSAARSNRLA